MFTKWRSSDINNLFGFIVRCLHSSLFLSPSFSLPLSLSLSVVYISFNYMKRFYAMEIFKEINLNKSCLQSLRDR